MMSTAVYTCADHSNSFGKEALIYENVEIALASLAEIEHRRLDERDGAAAARSLPGLAEIKTNARVIALGRAAHTVLADYRKRTLIAGDLDLFGDGDGLLAEEIDRFVWSCINTMKVVALGHGAWRSAQLMPWNEPRFYSLPPLHLAPQVGPLAKDGVLVVNHDRQGTHARALVDALRSAGMTVDTTGVALVEDTLKDADACWSHDAFFHVHVGFHTRASEALRVIDSWHSRRLAFQMLPHGEPEEGSEPLLIVDEVNGFVCHDPNQVLMALKEIRQDTVLQKKILENACRTVAPLALAWTTIAEDLLS